MKSGVVVLVMVSNKFDAVVIEEIRQLTAGNQHSEALVVGARMLGAVGLESKLKLVGELHELEGYLPHDLGNYRRILYQAVMDYAYEELSDVEYKLFYGAF